MKVPSPKADAARTAKIADEATEPDDIAMRLRFSLALAIRHPNMDPNGITRALGREPYQAWRAGEPRRTPSGHPMPSVGRESYWVWRTEIAGERNFFAALMAEVDWLEVHAAMLAGIVAEGGRIVLSLALPGDVNIGATLPHDAVRRLATLPIGLGVEVFPDMDTE